MKKLIVALSLMLPFIGNAQSTEGKIVFQEKIKIDFEGRVDDEMMEQPGMKEMMKKLQEQASKTKNVLVFRDGESMYRKFDAQQDAETSWTSADGAVEMQMMVMRPSSIVYRNTAENTLVEQHDFMGKFFLIEETPEQLKWKMTGEAEAIAGYNCQKATTKRDTSDITVWFTPEIPVSNGPQIFAGLPGMILKVDIDNQRLVIEAQRVDLEGQDEKIEVPTKGKKVARDEFNEIREKKYEEMREMRGGNRRGGMHIQIDRD